MSQDESSKAVWIVFSSAIFGLCLAFPFAVIETMWLVRSLGTYSNAFSNAFWIIVLIIGFVMGLGYHAIVWFNESCDK
ncbi:hypothetical protein CA54_43710 [Symmachiella macrocystis]|uniref:Uncharacterized protein n=1 Tax=Symmachiella macrocystis TaxID=2527985 RepID=A0A5C6BCA4_9PLAN|nr:hypothetical protein CA54_43710 [Symmachiella macrocystis]